MKVKDSLVSIVFPCYNHAQYLKECLDSILNQTYKNIEVIVLDDASTDNSYDIMKEYAKKDKRIKVLQNKKNEGCIASGNIAFKKAQGKYINFFSADDKMVPTNIQKKVEVLERYPKCGIVFSENIDIDDKGNVLRLNNRRKKKNYYEKNDFIDFIKDESYIISNTMLIRKDFFERIGYQKEEYGLAAELFAQLRLVNEPCCYLNENLVFFRHHNQNWTATMDVKKLKNDFFFALRENKDIFRTKKEIITFKGTYFYVFARGFYHKKDYKNGLKYFFLSFVYNPCVILKKIKRKVIG